MKKIILMLGIALLLVTGCKKEEETIGEKAIANNHEDIVKEQKINTIAFQNISLIYQNGISTFSVDLYNENEEDIYLKSFRATFKNSNGTEIISLEIAVEDSIQAQTAMTTTITSDVDLSDAYSVEYSIQ